MIRLNNIRIPLDFDFNNLEKFCANNFKIDEKDIKSVRLAKKSVDARRKSDVHFIISVDISANGESTLLKKLKNAVPIEHFEYRVPKIDAEKSPVVVGFGPAGMFSALVLAMSGAVPIVLERGLDVDSRVKAVEKFQNGG